MKVILPKPGDVIYTKRNKHSSFGIPWPEYKHYGIYIGDYQVIHFAAPAGSETDSANAYIIQTSLRKFLKGDFLFIQTDREIEQYDNTLIPLSSGEVIQRAKSKLGQEKGKYDLRTNNCEHFANWCRYDKKFCRQLKEVPISVLKNITKEVLSMVAEGATQARTLSLPSAPKEIFLIKREK